MRISYWSSDVCSSDLARPRSDETMTEPTRLICARSTRYGCWNSEFACAMWPITCFIARAYGREAFIRSCALRILEAETISSARVTLRVFCTLLILVLISLPPAMFSLALLASGGLGSRDWGLGK